MYKRTFVLLFFVLIFCVNNKITNSEITHIGRSSYNANDCFIIEDGKIKVAENPCSICLTESGAIYGSGDENDLLYINCQNNKGLPNNENQNLCENCISDYCYDAYCDYTEKTCKKILVNPYCKYEISQSPDETCMESIFRPKGSFFCGKYVKKDNICVLEPIDNWCGNCFNVNPADECKFDALKNWCCENEWKGKPECTCLESKEEVIITIDEQGNIKKECKEILKRDYNSLSCYLLNKECEWQEIDTIACYDYELNNPLNRMGSFDCRNDELYRRYNENCKCQTEIRYNEKENKCYIKSISSFCEEEETNPCDCIDLIEQNCSKKLYSQCSSNCKTTTCLEGYHRDTFNSDKCGTYVLEKNICKFIETQDKLNCLGIEGTDSCFNDPIKMLSNSCGNLCENSYYVRSKKNANDCFVISPETNCEKQETDLQNCLGIMGSDDCNTDPIYNRYSNNCNIENYDSDNDGIDDRFELKECLNTQKNSPVDKNGCSCQQKTCNDNNPCTDDYCDEKANCVFTTNNECQITCTKTNYFRSKKNANDCFVISPETNCEKQETDLQNCLGIMGSDDCNTDPIYNRYSNNCNIENYDSDNDGIDDRFELKECLNTQKNSPVDKNGCSCQQKTCNDNNPCTDDYCDEKANCVFINNKNSCGYFRTCPSDACENNYPFERWLNYPESSSDYCYNGNCMVYSCNLISATYSKTCDLDDDDDGDPDISDPYPDDPTRNTKTEEKKETICNKEAPKCELSLGVCEGSKKTCINNQWLTCDKNNYGNNYVIDETTNYCDGLDNDCDGTIDENCECKVNEIKECGINIGICKKGIQKCINGKWSTCENAIFPKNETCNNLDDDCDGLTDEDTYNSGDYTLKEECFINLCKGVKKCNSNCELLEDNDKDNYCTTIDNCPEISNTDQKDNDGDFIGDACDICPYDPLNDIDLDNVCGNIDNCPFTYNPEQKDYDNDGIGDACDTCPFDYLNDKDKDNLCENIDNCPNKFNPDQNDCDNNSIGDACDLDSICATDSDNDGIKDNLDNCILIYNPNQEDLDKDRIGDVCDIFPKDSLNDIDKDGISGNIDNCPNIYNQNQQDDDKDEIGNSCDFCPNDFLNDIDNDNICGNIDNCPYRFNPSQNDCDKDDIGDACDIVSPCSLDSDKDSILDIYDNCPEIFNPKQEDIDFDNIGDACDFFPKDPFNDIDKDGIGGDIDNCQNNYNHDQKDTDKDKIGDACDICPYDPLNDIDKDGICNNIFSKNLISDNCPFKYNPNQKDCDNNGIGDACDNSKCLIDFDNDGVIDNRDNCPETYNPNQLDRDGDKIGDACDICPKDPLNDYDNDGICGNIDNCPSISNSNQYDRDKDNFGDACDFCLYDSENDIDKDGICGNRDNCPFKYNPNQKDCDNNTIGDACDLSSLCVIDSDSDGIIDYRDNCPETYNPEQKDIDDDKIGDVCDFCINDKANDFDQDGICGNVDNCPKIYNPNQENKDKDLFGDACDLCPDDKDNDIDEDGICGNVDNCPLIKNPNQEKCEYILNEKIKFDKTIKINKEDLEKINAIGLINISKKDEKIFSKLKEKVKIEKKEYLLKGKKFTKYKITIEGEKLNNLIYYQNIPKCLADKAENIYFNGKNYNIIENDPIIAWHFSNVIDKLEITYDVEGTISEECLNELKDFIYSSVTEEKKKSLLPIILPLISIPIIIFLVIFLEKNKK